MRLLYIFIFLVFTSITCEVSAQGETSNWLFGTYHIKFENDTPSFKTIVHGLYNCCASSGGTSISDKDGNFLFATDGEFVVEDYCDTSVFACDSTIIMLDQMANGGGILGFQGSYQNIIIPRPGYDNRYYLLTTPYVPGVSTGLRYSEIDMSLNDGNGEVLNPKNNTLIGSGWITSQISSVYHANGKDIWVIVHGAFNDAFLTYLVTENGFSQWPIVSNIGLEYSGVESILGEMKFSTNGKRVAVAAMGNNAVQILDFDNETGALSNPVILSNLPWVHSLEFSPDGTILYYGNSRHATTTMFTSLDTCFIHKADLISNDSLTIVSNTDCLMNTTDDSRSRVGLQIASNLKMYLIFTIGYVNNQMNDTLYTLDNPNSPDQISNDFSPVDVYPTPNYPNHPSIILPNFFRSYLDKNIVFENQCFGDSTLICTQTNTDFDSIRWEFEDPVGILNSIPNQDTIYHTFSEPGIYEVILKRYRDGYLDEDKRMLYIHPNVDVNLGNDTLLCEGTELQIQLNDTFVQYAWLNDFSTDTIYSDTAYIATSGNWWPILTNFEEYCGNLDTINVIMHPDSLFIGNDTANTCISSPIILDATLDSATSYLWSTGETTSIITATISNYYIVEVTQGYCTFTDTIHILYDEPLFIDLPDTSIVCDSIPIELSVIDIQADYLWSPTGETTPEIMVTSPGIYSVTASNGCGDFIDSTIVLSLLSPVVNFGNDTIICSTDSVFLNAVNPSSSYVWSGGSGDSSIWVSVSGQFFVTVTNECGNAYDSILIETENSVFINLGNDTIICFGEELLITPEIIGEGLIQWSNGETTQEISVIDDGEYILSVTNICGEFTDTINLTVQINDFAFAWDTIFISGGDSTILSGPDSSLSGVEVYSWSTGESTQNITVTNTGTYLLTYTDSIGCIASDSIVVSWPISINTISSFQDIKIYPNPVSNELTIEALKGDETITIRDFLGRKIKRIIVNNTLLMVSFDQQPKGVYLLMIERKGEIKNFKVVRR